MMWVLYCLYALTAIIIIAVIIIKYKVNHSKLKWILIILSTIMVIITGAYQIKIYQMNKAYREADEKFGKYAENFEYYLHSDSLITHLDDQPGYSPEIIFDDENKDETEFTISNYKKMKKQLGIMKLNNTGKYNSSNGDAIDFNTHKGLFKNCTITLYETTSYNVLKRNNLLPSQNH